ncbi:HEAT repeat domain-containing protein [Corallococcus sp. AB049A]|uniref:HEAT repeat domain-containing protein n=1 Tax=Corallococcus interemptor TaxID=2316720 RepID=A0A3A8QZ70_9BACT|nr:MULTISPECIES: HEAT repeat domain-containing protein [Corallococcus]RKH51461.1 HEAT repeat domain-containing protein [Corallococcus sp. AB050B]RKH68434.1 HEAT repeat domain-containing protein [Corallococcus interemptor]RKI41915.1 HEAT repeat domain-containing protein [Corallococcus sp. AB049A]
MRLPTALLLFFFLLPVTALAQGDTRITFLGRQLEKGRDPRARSQAALVLGATEDPEAVTPLCGGLKDPSELVRAAVAKGLGALLEPKGLDCLQAVQGEADATVQAAVAESIKAIKAYQARRPRFYLSLDALKDKTGSVPADLVKVTEARLRSKLVRRGAQMAPEKESKAAAKGALKKLGVHGYRITAEIQKTDSGGLRLALLCMTYPEQSLMGQVEVNAAGAPPADLLKALIPKAIEEAAATFDWSSET